MSGKSLAKVEKTAQKSEVENLISMAIQNNVPVESLERLLAMRRELRAEQAKQAFDEAMASFQASCPTIKKTKVVKTSSGAEAYKYAPIESIVEQVKTHLKKNGFSYSSNMELQDDHVKVSIKVTHSGGHSEITDMKVPLGTRTAIMSATQQVAAAQTFAKRYAFCNAFGILTGDEDTDARPDKPEGPKSLPKRTTEPREITRVPIEEEKIAAPTEESTENDRPISSGQKIILAGLIRKGKLPDLTFPAMQKLSYDKAQEYVIQAGYGKA